MEERKISKNEKKNVSCILCCEAINFFAYSPCNHIDICALCIFKLKEKEKSTTCMICKISNPIIIIDMSPLNSFETLNKRKLIKDAVTLFLFPNQSTLDEFHKEI